MSRNAYQFKLKNVLPIGSFVRIEGQYDKFGKVYGHSVDEKGHHHLIHHIRGIGNSLPNGKRAWPLEEQDDG